MVLVERDTVVAVSITQLENFFFLKARVLFSAVEGKISRFGGANIETAHIVHLSVVS